MSDTKFFLDTMVDEFGSDNYRQALSTGSLGDRLWLKGAEALVEKAMELIPGLPENLVAGGPAYGEPYSRVRSIEDPDGKYIEAYACFAGWLTRLASCQEEGRVLTLTRLMEAGLRKRGEEKSRGMASPYTSFNLWQFVARFRTPELANRKAAAIIRRADVILKPYGLRASWALVGKVMAEGSPRTGKAALRLADATVRGVLERNFNLQVPTHVWADEEGRPIRPKHLRSAALEAARGGLAQALRQPVAIRAFIGHLLKTGEAKNLAEAMAAVSRLQPDATDGVQGYLDPTTRQTAHGIESALVWIEEWGGRRRNNRVGRFVWLVRVGGQTFHTSGNRSRQGESGRREAVREALGAIKRRREAERANRALFDLERLTPLVFREDSYAAGNCQPGTEAFLRQHGWQGRQFVPVTWLLAIAGDYRVSGVLKVVATRVATAA